MTENERKRREFGEYVRACERCAHEAVRPWKIACGILTAGVVLLSWSIPKTSR